MQAETVTQVTTVETVDREQMDLTNAKDVSQALETLPGVFISKGTRNEAYLNVRGFNQRYVPIFYDGIPLYIPNDGYTDPSELLDRQSLSNYPHQGRRVCSLRPQYHGRSDQYRHHETSKNL